MSEVRSVENGQWVCAKCGTGMLPWRMQCTRCGKAKPEPAKSGAVENVEPTFKKEDVWAVARVVADNWWYYDDSRRNDYYGCNHCSAKTGERSFSDMQHDPSCPVLIARDLLTGAP